MHTKQLWVGAWWVGLFGLMVAMRPAVVWAQDSGAPDEAVSEAEVEKSGAQPWNQGVDRETRMAAREIFREGNRLLKVPLFAQAAEKYEEALRLWKHPAFYYNLAIAQINLVQPIAAYESLERAMAHGPEPLLGKERYEQAVDYRTRLKSQLATIEVSCDELGAEVLLNGEFLFTAPGKAVKIVLPGSHLLVAQKTGLNAETQQAVVSAGDTRTYRLVWRRVVIKRYMPVWIPWALISAGGLLLGGAGYVDWDSSQKLDEYDEQFATQCSSGCMDSEQPELVADIRSAEQRKYAAISLYAVGSAAFVTGAVLVYINRERLVRSRDHEDSLGVMPLFLPHGVGLSAMMRFK